MDQVLDQMAAQAMGIRNLDLGQVMLKQRQILMLYLDNCQQGMGFWVRGLFMQHGTLCRIHTQRLARATMLIYGEKQWLLPT